MKFVFFVVWRSIQATSSPEINRWHSFAEFLSRRKSRRVFKWEKRLTMKNVIYGPQLVGNLRNWSFHTENSFHPWRFSRPTLYRIVLHPKLEIKLHLLADARLGLINLYPDYETYKTDTILEPTDNILWKKTLVIWSVLSSDSRLLSEAETLNTRNGGGFDESLASVARVSQGKSNIWLFSF